MKTVHIVIANGKGSEVFAFENIKKVETLCGREVLHNGLANDTWWNDGQLCPECHKLMVEKKSNKTQRHYVTGVGDMKNSKEQAA